MGTPSHAHGPAGRIVALIQARAGSTRLPEKVLADICGRPMLWHVVDRVRRSRLLDDVVVATTTQPGDDRVALLCDENGWACFRGSEEDVLDRFTLAAREARADAVVRVTADCPLIDPEVIDRVVEEYCRGDAGYVSNILVYTWPQGLDVEVFSVAALERAWREAVLPAEREHVTPWLRASPDVARRDVRSDLDGVWHGQRWTVDEEQDLHFVRAIYARLWTRERRDFRLHDVVRLLEQEPALRGVWPDAAMHEGYFLSLAREPALPPSVPEPGVAAGLTGRGAYLRDAAGNAWIDLAMHAGQAVLGHACPAVEDAFRQGASRDARALAAELAEALLAATPGAERVLLTPDGRASVEAALRLARRATGRAAVVCPGPGNDAVRTLDATASVAAVLVEPARWELAPLLALRERVRARGAVLVFDETASGFRLAPAGQGPSREVTPDLWCYGRTLANGHPLAAVVGDRALHDAAGPEPVDPGVLAAALATLRELREGDVAAWLHEKGRKLRDGVNVLARAFGLGDRVRCHGPEASSRLELDGNDATRVRFARACARRGVLSSPTQHLSLAHGDGEIDQVLRAYRAVFESWEEGIGDRTAAVRQEVR
jgi:spore coat polysaccharide biosynthesis protein SpsF (cytidylyltransferase family)/glutamate-1-semialdehyde aminotransferase